MGGRLKLWDQYSNWNDAEKAWDEDAERAALKMPVKGLKSMPSMPGITEDAAKNLEWKSFKWIIAKDHRRKILKGFLRHPLKYGWGYLKSLFHSKPYKRDGDFFLYGVDKAEQFEKLLAEPETLFVIGFSYCHKPFECPSGRFTSDCQSDLDNPVCRQCFIGKCVHASPAENCIPLFIPTIHYIGEKIFDIVHQNPAKKVLFLITACEMTLEMFGDLGNMVGIKGIGVRLDGRICNTMKAFELSEEGIKPGLTVVLDDTKQRILRLLSLRRGADQGLDFEK